MPIRYTLAGCAICACKFCMNSKSKTGNNFFIVLLGWWRDVYSHSIVAGGLLLMSYTTRLMPRTLLMISLLMCAKNS